MTDRKKSYRTLVLDAWTRTTAREAREYLRALFTPAPVGSRLTLALDVLDEEPVRLMSLFSCLRLRNAVEWEESGIEEVSIDVPEVLEGISEEDVIFAAFAPREYTNQEWPQDEAEEFAEGMGVAA